MTQAVPMTQATTTRATGAAAPAIRRRLRVAAGIAAALAAWAVVPAAAQQLTEREARAAVASPRGATVLVADLDFLTPQLRSALEAVAKQLPYYAAIAVSPGEPSSSQLNPGVVNFHSPDAARQMALAPAMPSAPP